MRKGRRKPPVKKVKPVIRGEERRLRIEQIFGRVIPEEELHAERLKWLTVFPLEIWTLILEHVTDLKTLEICNETSTFLKELVQNKSKIYLFPKVLELMEKLQYVDTYNFTYRELLNCRLVCTGWNEAANEILQNRPYHKTVYRSHRRYGLYNEALTDASARIIFKIYDYTINKLDTRIMPALNSPYYVENNPFPTRHLEIWERCISEETPDVFLRYRNTTQLLLELVGKHFWHVQIQILEPTGTEWYTRLWKYVSLMPNLRTLIISTGYQKFPEDLVQQFPFPTLPHLHKVTFDATDDFMVNTILAANRHIKVFEMIMLGGIKENPVDLNLVENAHSVALFVRSPEEFFSIPNRWKLQMFRVDFIHCKGFVPWSEIFGKVGNYRETLDELIINLPYAIQSSDVKDLWEDSKVELDLPKLKRLQVEIHGNCTIDFLLGLPALQYLKLWIWHIEKRKEDDNSKTDEIVLFKDKYVKESTFIWSNIWKLIPTLKVVELRGEYGKRFCRNHRNQIIRSG